MGLELKSTAHNWAKWIEQVDVALRISAMIGYTDGHNPVLNTTLEPCTMSTHCNDDGEILTFIRQKTEDRCDRAPTIKGCFTSKEAVELLHHCHLNFGPRSLLVVVVADVVMCGPDGAVPSAPGLGLELFLKNTSMYISLS